jgi:hypothetical protein
MLSNKYIKNKTIKIWGTTTSFTAFIGIKTSSIGWHLRLGHLSSDIVAKVIKNFDLPLLVNDLSKEFVCDSCQLGKGKR